MFNRWVIGDIHGCIHTFRALVEKLELQENDCLYLLGDYIDRGMDSRAVIDFIFTLKKQAAFQVIPLMGNHEYMLMYAREDPAFFQLWMLNSGITTLRDFHLIYEGLPDQSIISKIPRAYMDFFTGLKMYEEIPGFFLCHGCFEGNAPNPIDDTSSMIWGRIEKYPEHFLKGNILVHGHTPASLDAISKNVENPSAKIINLDAGCVYKNTPFLGNLIALELGSRRLVWQKNID